MATCVTRLLYRAKAAMTAPRSANGAATAPAPDVALPVWVGLLPLPPLPPPPPPPWVEVMVVFGGGLVAV